MKFIAIFFAACVAAIVADPISLKDNNLGDILNVGVNANVDLKNQVDQNIVNALQRYHCFIEPTSNWSQD
jgi:hypothetical protein